MSTGQARRVPKKIPGLERICRDVVYPHVFAHPDREVGGVLVGRIPEPGGPPKVKAAIPALHADERVASLTFTHEAWDHVHREMDAHHPGDVIVGWYHSHPGFGIFLSSQDMFIHENFFRGPSQIALVVDPHAGTEGVFFWHHGAVEKLFERNTARPALTPDERSAARAGLLNDETWEYVPPRHGARYPLLPLIIAGVLGMAIGLLGWRAVDHNDPVADPVVTSPVREPKPSGGTVAQTAPKREVTAPPNSQAVDRPEPAPTTASQGEVVTISGSPSVAGDDELGSP